MKKTDNIQRGILKGLKNCLWKTKFFSCKRGSSNLSIDKIKSLFLAEENVLLLA